MADHLRKQIREAAVTTLTGLTTTATRVFDSRVRLIQQTDCPCLRVYCDDEEIELASMGIGARDRKRTLRLIVEGCVATNSSPEDTVDLIAKEVEVALDNNNGLGGLVKWIEPRRIETEFSGEGETLVAVIRLQFEVLYHSAKGAPDVTR